MYKRQDENKSLFSNVSDEIEYTADVMHNADIKIMNKSCLLYTSYTGR